MPKKAKHGATPAPIIAPVLPANIGKVVPSRAGPIPASYFGHHIVGPNSDVWGWPAHITVGPVRVWDVVNYAGATYPLVNRWSGWNTADGVYSWTELDITMATYATNGVTDLSFCFGFTPTWLANGGVSTAAPSNMTKLGDAVTALLQKYPGRFSSVEIWNEWEYATFYTGTVAQMVSMAQAIYNAVKAHDPNIRVRSPSVNMDYPSASGLELFEDFLVAGGSAYFDDVAIHGYWPAGDEGTAEGLIDIFKGGSYGAGVHDAPYNGAGTYRGIKDVLADNGISGRRIIVTEGGWGENAWVPVEADQTAYLPKYIALIWSLGADRQYWYAYDQQDWGTLRTVGNVIRQPGTALNNVRNWMLGATCFNRPNGPTVAGAVYSIDFARSGYSARMIWAKTGTPSYSVPAQYTRYRTIAGATTSVSGSVTLGNAPILLESGSPGPAILDGNLIAVTLNAAGLTATHASTATNSGTRTTTLKSTGKHYFEVTANDWDGVGDCVGILTSGGSYANLVTAGSNCAAVYKSGNVWSNNASSGKTLGAINNGDVIGFAVDFDNDKIWPRKAPSGDWNGEAIGLQDPGGNVGGVSFSTFAADWMGPAIGFGDTGTQAGNNTTANFGASAFSGTAPSGFTSGWLV